MAHHFEIEKAVLAALLEHSQAKLRGLGLSEVYLPDDDAEARCAIFASADWEKKEQLLLVLQNAVGARPGLWSRSLCLSHGMTRGSMLPCIEQALESEMGVIILVRFELVSSSFVARPTWHRADSFARHRRRVFSTPSASGSSAACAPTSTDICPTVTVVIVRSTLRSAVGLCSSVTLGCLARRDAPSPRRPSRLHSVPAPRKQ